MCTDEPTFWVVWPVNRRFNLEVEKEVYDCEIENHDAIPAKRVITKA